MLIIALIFAAVASIGLEFIMGWVDDRIDEELCRMAIQDECQMNGVLRTLSARLL